MPIPTVLPEAFNQYPQGYYPFAESPAKIPPKVRKPPYLQTQVNCPGKSYVRWTTCPALSKLVHFLGVANGQVSEQTLDNLCGDLNKGYLPLNPMGQSIEGVSYPL